MVDLGRHLDRSRLHVAGLGILALPADGPLLAKAHRSMPVYFGPEACDMLARSVDVLVFWGTGELTPISAPECTVYVSHGAGACAKHWAPLVAAKRIHLAAVSQWAARIFPLDRAMSLWAHSQSPTSLAAGEAWPMSFEEFVLEFQPQAYWFYRLSQAELLAPVRLDAVVRVERLEEDLFRLPPNMKVFVLNCGICGCRLRGRRALINLARYVETRRWGCKHPGGSRWKKAGV